MLVSVAQMAYFAPQKQSVMGQKVLITGATKGIGKALSQLFAEQSFDLALVARTTEDLVSLRADLRQQFPGAEVLIFPCDLAQPEQIERLCQDLVKAWDHLDVLINNAGLFYQGELLAEPAAHMQEMMAVNVMAPYHLCRALTPLVQKAPSGHIFNICSVASRKIFPGSGSYATTKFALLGFTKALRQELQEQDIKVTAVLPGATWTASWEGANISEERLMQAADVAQAIWQCTLLSPSAVVEELLLRPQRGDL